MRIVPQYDFFKTKYGEELLIDIVTLNEIKKYIDKHPVHTLSYYDITFIESGSGFLSVDNIKYKLNSGDIVFSMPGEIRSWDSFGNINGYALIFEEEFLLSFFNDPLFLRNLSFFNLKRTYSKINIDGIKKRINFLFRNISVEINGYSSKDKHILRSLLYEVLMLLNREYNIDLMDEFENCRDAKNTGISSRHVHSFVSLADKDFKEHHNAKYYADKLCITPNYLNEVIKKALGVNVKHYIRNKILSEAKRLLVYTNLSISEIADTLHFDDSSYFIRFFRLQTGFTPLQYRNGIKR